MFLYLFFVAIERYLFMFSIKLAGEKRVEGG